MQHRPCDKALLLHVPCVPDCVPSFPPVYSSLPFPSLAYPTLLPSTLLPVHHFVHSPSCVPPCIPSLPCTLSTTVILTADLRLASTYACTLAMMPQGPPSSWTSPYARPG